MSLVELARYSDAALAHIVKGRLEAAGIPAHCFDTGMNFAEGVPMMFQVRVMVLDDDLEAASQILAEDPVAETPAVQLIPRAAEGYTTGRRRRRLALYLVLGIFLAYLAAVTIAVAGRQTEQERLEEELDR